VQLFDDFVKSRRYLKNVTAKTLVWYRTSFTTFQRLHHEPTYTKESLRAFVVTLRESGVSPISCNTYCRAINAYLRWLHEEGHADTLLRIAPLKTEQKVIATFTAADVRKFITYRPRTFGQHRLHALTLALLDTGLRIEEALTLTRERVDLDNLLLTVDGKGQKQRVVPMSLELRKVLYRWTQKHQFPLVFPTRGGGRLTQRNLLRDLKQWGRDVGIGSGVRVSFHTLRHTFAVNYIRNGGDVFRLQRILGHTGLEMTRRYVNLQTADLQTVHHRLSPLSTAS
jgi:integrase/recombinase XerD